jgi:K+-transporting ATPase KdpF subunit
LLPAGTWLKPARNCERIPMDYVIAGIAAVLLFIYLVYALLKPEKF